MNNIFYDNTQHVATRWPNARNMLHPTSTDPLSMDSTPTDYPKQG